MPATVRMQQPQAPKRLSRAQRREADKRNEELITYGVSLQDIKSLPGSGRFFLCFVRAMLIFLAGFGMVGGRLRRLCALSRRVVLCMSDAISPASRV